MFSSLSPKSGRAAGRGWSFLRLLTGRQTTFEKRTCQFSSLLVTERASLLKWCFQSHASHAAPSCHRSPSCESFLGTGVRLALSHGYAVTQSHGHPSMRVFELGKPAAKAYTYRGCSQCLQVLPRFLVIQSISARCLFLLAASRPVPLSFFSGVIVMRVYCKSTGSGSSFG